MTQKGDVSLNKNSEVGVFGDKQGYFFACRKNVCCGCGKCPEISNTKVSDKMTYANSADPVQTAPEGAV